MRRSARRLRALFAVAIVAALTASAPAADSDVTTSYGFATFGTLKYPANFTHFAYTNPDAPKGGVYRAAQLGYFDSFNAFDAIAIAPISLTGLYDQLLSRSGDEPASYYGLLAETLSYPRDIGWVEFKLREKARFSDGTPVTPEDVIFSLNALRGLTVRPVFRRIAASVKDVIKTGPHSVRFILSQKNNRTLVTTVGELMVVPAHYYRHRDFLKKSMEKPVGSGPYEIDRFSPGRSVTLRLRKDYWGKDLPVNKGRYNMDLRTDYYRDAAVMAEAFLSGDYDARIETSALQWPSERRLPQFRDGDLIRSEIHYTKSISYQGIVLNTRRPFFSDRRVREAMLHAFDFEWFRANVLHGYHGRVTDYFQNSAFGIHGVPIGGERAMLEPWRTKLPPALFTRPISLPVLGSRQKQRDNLLQAAALLKAAGYRIENLRLVYPGTHRPVALDFMLGMGVAQERYVAQFVRNLDRLGVTVNLKIYDTSTVRQLTARYDFDMRISLPGVPVLITPGSEMKNQYGSAGVTQKDSGNLAGVDDPVVDALLETIATARDRETVVDAMRALDRVLMWGIYSIPLHHIYPAPTGVMPFTYWNKFGRPPIEARDFFGIPTDTWWIDTAKQAALRKRLGKDI
ncbi:extracellular solute-binding protein [Sphingobium nicotianae]|uniref:Extracellular solute-binding protein n=1 Tax=Sphingobium nicotianae TaxID=2782607 RepID=A0A9X1DAI8_9SPHN|nr:extracellular solute-binding protein [Sphingobium nicotianae]